MAIPILTASNVTKIHSARSSVVRRSLQFFESPTPSAGFPSPAQDYIESGLDLNEYLIRNRPATFFCQVAGESMTGAGIFDRDIVAVDRSIKAVPGRIVVASADGNLLVKWLSNLDGRLALTSDHPTLVYPPAYLDSYQEVITWGCVTGLVRRFNAFRRDA